MPQGQLQTTPSQPDGFARLNNIVQRFGHAPVKFIVHTKVVHHVSAKLDERTRKLLENVPFLNAIGASTKRTMGEPRKAKEDLAHTIAGCLEIVMATQQNQQPQVKVEPSSQQQEAKIAPAPKQKPLQAKMTPATSRQYQQHPTSMASTVQLTQQGTLTKHQGMSEFNDSTTQKMKNRAGLIPDDDFAEPESPSTRVLPKKRARVDPYEEFSEPASPSASRPQKRRAEINPYGDFSESAPSRKRVRRQL